VAGLRVHRPGRQVRRPGYGETLPPAGPWSHHADLLALIDELGLGRAHLVGTSMGAGIAVEAALARPRAVASLLLVAPGGALLGDGAIRCARSGTRRSRRSTGAIWTPPSR
jgi:pimeloyl-ACP methyl ester carboxylesterase